MSNTGQNVIPREVTILDFSPYFSGPTINRHAKKIFYIAHLLYPVLVFITSQRWGLSREMESQTSYSSPGMGHSSGTSIEYVGGPPSWMVAILIMAALFMIIINFSYTMKNPDLSQSLNYISIVLVVVAVGFPILSVMEILSSDLAMDMLEIILAISLPAMVGPILVIMISTAKSFKQQIDDIKYKF